MGLSRSTKPVASSDLRTRVRRFYAYQTASSFSIGTSAYLYEVLLESGHETEFPRYIGRVTMIQLLSNAAGAFVGGVFVGVVGDLRLTLLVGAILNLGAVGVAVTFREPKVERTPESTYVEQLVQGLRVVRRREGVALLIGVEVFLGVTLYVMAVFRPLYLQALGLSESAIAISISGFLLVAAIWSAFAGTITRVLGEFGTLALLVLMASAAFFGMYGAGQFPGAALLQVPLYIVWSLQPAPASPPPPPRAPPPAGGGGAPGRAAPPPAGGGGGAAGGRPASPRPPPPPRAPPPPACRGG